MHRTIIQSIDLPQNTEISVSPPHSKRPHRKRRGSSVEKQGKWTEEEVSI